MTALDERLDVLETQLRELRYAAGVEPRAAPLGFFQVQPGETILSDHMNTAILQGVPPFASVAARDAAITNRVNGMRCVTLDTYTTWLVIGGVWRPWPDQGAYQATTNASGQVSIPHKLGVTPAAVLLTVMGSSGGVAATCRVDSTTSTTIGVSVRGTTGTNIASTLVTIGWQAYPPAP